MFGFGRKILWDKIGALENKILALEAELKKKTEVAVGPEQFYSETRPNPGGFGDYYVLGMRKQIEPINEVVKLLLEYLKLEVVTKTAEPEKKELATVKSNKKAKK